MQAIGKHDCFRYSHTVKQVSDDDGGAGKKKKKKDFVAGYYVLRGDTFQKICLRELLFFFFSFSLVRCWFSEFLLDRITDGPPKRTCKPGLISELIYGWIDVAIGFAGWYNITRTTPSTPASVASPPDLVVSALLIMMYHSRRYLRPARFGALCVGVAIYSVPRLGSGPTLVGAIQVVGS